VAAVKLRIVQNVHVRNDRLTRTWASVERAFAGVSGKSHLSEVRLYDLRHTMATLMLYQGEQLKLVAGRLGHANETMVLRNTDGTRGR